MTIQDLCNGFVTVKTIRSVVYREGLSMRLFVACLATCFIALPAMAQNTSGVSGAKVSASDKGLEFRAAFVPGEDGAPDRTAFRFHYQKGLADNLRLRIIASGSNRGNGADYDALKAEIVWQMTPDAYEAWASALRFEATLRDGDRPEQLGVNWINEFPFERGWVARTNLIVARDVGDFAMDGVLLQTRASLGKSFGDGYSLSGLLFSNYGSSERLGRFDTQNHQLGPVLSGKTDAGWTWSVGSMFGLSEAAADTDLRFWIGRNF